MDRSGVATGVPQLGQFVGQQSFNSKANSNPIIFVNANFDFLNSIGLAGANGVHTKFKP